MTRCSCIWPVFRGSPQVGWSGGARRTGLAPRSRVGWPLALERAIAGAGSGVTTADRLVATILIQVAVGSTRFFVTESPEMHEG